MGVGIKGFGGSPAGPKLKGIHALPPAAVAAANIFDDGFVDGISGLTLNPADKGTNIALSNGDLSYTNSSGYEAVRATAVIPSGFWYWEIGVVANVTGNQHFIVGIMNGSVSLDSPSYPGFTTPNGWGFSGLAKVSSAVFTATSFASDAELNFGQNAGGETLMIALDVDNNKIWFGMEGQWESGVTPTQDGPGTAFSLFGGPWYAAVSSTATPTPQAGTMKFTKASLTHTVPVGFSPLGA